MSVCHSVKIMAEQFNTQPPIAEPLVTATQHTQLYQKSAKVVLLSMRRLQKSGWRNIGKEKGRKLRCGPGEEKGRKPNSLSARSNSPCFVHLRNTSQTYQIIENDNGKASRMRAGRWIQEYPGENPLAATARK